jgi:hypothetical protein
LGNGWGILGLTAPLLLCAPRLMWAWICAAPFATLFARAGKSLLVCQLAASFRDPPHLLWSLDRIAEGSPANIVRVHPDARRDARLALERMLRNSGTAAADSRGPQGNAPARPGIAASGSRSDIAATLVD